MAYLLRQFTNQPQRRAPTPEVSELADSIREEARALLTRDDYEPSDQEINEQALLLTLAKSHDTAETDQVVAQMQGGGQLVPLYARIKKHQQVDHETGEVTERYEFGYDDLSADELARVIRANRAIAAIPNGEWI
jgi:hypothetical protein